MDDELFSMLRLMATGAPWLDVASDAIERKKGFMSGPNFIGKRPDYFLRELANKLELNIEMKIEKGWLRVDVDFEVIGRSNQVKEFFKEFNKEIEDWNKAWGIKK